jgi:hypothetical protein
VLRIDDRVLAADWNLDLKKVIPWEAENRLHVGITKDALFKLLLILHFLLARPLK